MLEVLDISLTIKVYRRLTFAVCLSVTDAGTVLKVVSITRDQWSTEEIVLEELQVFQVGWTPHAHTHTN